MRAADVVPVLPTGRLVDGAARRGDGRVLGVMNAALLVAAVVGAASGETSR